MATSTDTRVEYIASAIERYLARNRQAADSTLGIAQWWLPSVGAEGTPEEVEMALLLLQARGTVERVGVGDCQEFWRTAARARQDEDETNTRHG